MRGKVLVPAEMNDVHDIGDGKVHRAGHVRLVDGDSTQPVELDRFMFPEEQIPQSKPRRSDRRRRNYT